MDTIIGEKYIQYLSERNYDKLGELFQSNVIGRLLIPGGLLTVYTSENLIKKISSWFGESDVFELLESTVFDMGGKMDVKYKFKGRENGGWYIVEQQTFSKITEGKISIFDLLCSGFQKTDG